MFNRQALQHVTGTHMQSACTGFQSAARDATSLIRHQLASECSAPEVLYGPRVMASTSVFAVAMSLSLRTRTLATIQLMSVGADMMRSLVKLPYVALADAPAHTKQMLHNSESHLQHCCAALQA